jgi:hypothetical protein
MNKKQSINIQVNLTDAEKLKYSKEMSEAVSAKARAEDNLKSFSTQTKAEIASFDATINKIAEKLNTGKEYRLIECEVKTDFKTKTKKFIDKDGEVVREDILTDSELQQELAI